MAASSSNTAGQPKYDPRNASDGLRIVLRDPVASGQKVSAVDGLIIAPPILASTSVALSSASSSRMKHLPYDVFINHHGLDTKHTVANRIYNSLDIAGIRVLSDKNELELGDFFPTVLEEAMRSAGLHIVIFSEHYAQSPWCLAELAFMVETGTTIIPIFYHVQLSTVRWAIEGKGIYADAFSNHEMKSSEVHENRRRYSSKQLEDWKRALHKASYFTGEFINNLEDEQRVVKNVVNRVLKEMNNVSFEVANYPVGLDKAVLDFDKIAVQSDGPIKVVGIWGPGGSGKTTLAKKIFNNKRLHINRSSFLFDLRDAAQKGLLVEKQKKLMEDLGVESRSFGHVDQGVGILKSRLRSVCVLIILDDVDHKSQFDALLPARESLGQGSLIVVTTRELGVLLAAGISANYQMEGLSPPHDKQLFCWHAFLQSSPPLELEALVERFLNACKGQPLLLKVSGAQLYGKFRKDYWQSLLEKISRIMPFDIKSRLKLSYDALDDEEKEMFLDIACFFIGERKSVAIAVWEESGWSGLHGWENLFNKSLVEVEGDDCIRMHDHLRDLGREVADGRSPYRLWSPQQTIKIHSQQEAIRIRGLVNAIGDDHYLRQGMRSLPLGSLGLKIFVGDGDFISQDNNEISRELVWLRCHGFKHKYLPSWLSLKNIRVLELIRMWSLEGLWECDADVPSQLRELVIQSCISLREMEGLQCLGSLETLNVSDCPNLGRLPILKNLIPLKKIDLRMCDKLKKIEVLRSLRSLEILNISECPELDSLAGLSEVTSLQEIQLGGCYKLENIEGLQCLRYLKTLKISYCPELYRLPYLGDLIFLKIFDLRMCHKLKKVEGLQRLTSLEVLNISDCPELDRLPNLSEIDFPKNIKLKKCHTLEKMEGIQDLTSLKTLRISDCPQLDRLPGLEELIDLKKIDLSHLSIIFR